MHPGIGTHLMRPIVRRLRVLPPIGPPAAALDLSEDIQEGALTLEQARGAWREPDAVRHITSIVLRGRWVERQPGKVLLLFRE